MPDTVLAVESSCDDTCVAVVNSRRQILFNQTTSQVAAHQPCRGVVPEVAARLHSAHLGGLLEGALSAVNKDDLSAIAATGGPGLMGGLLTGVSFAKAFASALGKPFLAINHLEGHALTVRLTDAVEYPYLLLLVSGGHCQFVAILGFCNYKILGTTVDDAVGETFDKFARMLGLGYPGGPLVEALAAGGDVSAFAMPKPMLDRPGCNLSFSGLKTYLRNLILSMGTLSEVCKRDMAASFQRTVGEILAAKSLAAIGAFLDLLGTSAEVERRFVASGGVAANSYLREVLKGVCGMSGFTFVAPPPRLCVDNAAMIGWAACEHLASRHSTSLAFSPMAKWSLEGLQEHYSVESVREA